MSEGGGKGLRGLRGAAVRVCGDGPRQGLGRGQNHLVHSPPSLPAALHTVTVTSAPSLLGSSSSDRGGSAPGDHISSPSLFNRGPAPSPRALVCSRAQGGRGLMWAISGGSLSLLSPVTLPGGSLWIGQEGGSSPAWPQASPPTTFSIPHRVCLVCPGQLHSTVDQKGPDGRRPALVTPL